MPTGSNPQTVFLDKTRSASSVCCVRTEKRLEAPLSLKHDPALPQTPVDPGPRQKRTMKESKCADGGYLHNILPWMVGGNQLFSIIVQLGDGALLGLQTFTDEILLVETNLLSELSLFHLPCTCVNSTATSYCLCRAG